MISREIWAIFFLLPLLTMAAPSKNEKEMKGPVFVKEPENRIDFSNSSGAVVECRANSVPPPEIIWVRSDGTAVGDVSALGYLFQVHEMTFIFLASCEFNRCRD